MSERPQQTMSAPAQRAAAGDEAARAARVRRSAWVLALLAGGFYIGFIAWNVLRGSIGI